MPLQTKHMIQAFNRSAPSYEKHAVLAQETGQRLLERLKIIRLQPQHILDLGCGTGWLTRLLKKRYPKAKVTGIDLAAAMLHHAKRQTGWFGQERYLQAAIECLPIADQSLDLVISNQALHWCQPLEAAIQECFRVLKPGGLWFFCCLGPDSLKELRHSWSQASRFTHVHRFADMHDIGDSLINAGFADPVMDIEYFTLTYADAKQMMQDLKNQGATNADIGRNPGLTTQHRLQACLTAYEKFRTTEGLIPASYEAVYGHAWKPLATKLAQADRSGEIRISLNQIKKS